MTKQVAVKSGYYLYERNEVGTDAGGLRVNLATYELQDVRRVAYWQMAASSAAKPLADRHSQ